MHKIFINSGKIIHLNIYGYVAWKCGAQTVLHTCIKADRAGDHDKHHRAQNAYGGKAGAVAFHSVYHA